MRGLIVAVLIAVATPAWAQQAPELAADQPAETTLWSRVETGLTQGFGREPQLMLAAAVLGGLLPVVSLMALVSRFGVRRWTARRPEPAVVSDIAVAPAIARSPPISDIRGQLPLLDVIGQDADVHRIDGNMIRIGRHEENDIRLASQTVHRYHAVLHRTPEQKFVITDLSGPAGNGVLVNAERVEQAALAAGDLIELGDVRLRFRFGEAH
jgi:FHA domain